MELNTKQEALNAVNESLQNAYDIALANKNLINNPFLHNSILSIMQKHCNQNQIAALAERKTSTNKNQRALVFTDEDLNPKKKPLKPVVVDEFAKLSEAEVKVMAFKEYGLKTAGKSKEILVEEIKWQRKSKTDSIKVNNDSTEEE